MIVSVLSIGVTRCGAQTLDPPDCRASGHVLPYAPLREADVMWERRVWRMIDLKDPRNAALRAPIGTTPGCLDLFGVLRHGLLEEGGLTAYAPDSAGGDAGFKAPMDRRDLHAVLKGIDSLPPGTIGRFAIKEDWVFDRARSVMEVRIIGMAPMAEVRGADGELRGYEPIFWLYYPECRHLLAWWTAIRSKDDERTSYEELFAQRIFSGVITKVGNMQDRSIAGGRTGLDALLQSEGIREQLERMGFDLWQY